MSDQFKEQGGASTMDPGPIRRWLVSRVMSHRSRAIFLEKQRAKHERARQRAHRPHVVEYFHQVDDGYSHLAAQVLPQLAQRYAVELVCHLVPSPTGPNAPEPELLLRLSREDAYRVAPEYGLTFPQHSAAPAASDVAQATAILAGLSGLEFAAACSEVGDALWRGQSERLRALAERHGSVAEPVAADRLAEGAARRRALAHYSGAMFYYEGEWYWGVDRLYHLEQRLGALGVDKQPQQPLLLPRPAIETGPLRDDGSLTLEVFPSLRSPYTAIGFDRAVALARATGVRLSVRPVLPMVMRGAPVTRIKGMYIFGDTAREARAAGVPYGKFYDPIGNPVRRAYSLYPWACEQGRSVELISAFLRCAFAEGVNTNTDAGLRKVVEQAGLDWQAAQQHLGDNAWEAQLEENRLAMYDAGLWGVPSFRLLDAAGEEILALWGQDRLWLFSREIQRHLAARH